MSLYVAEPYRRRGVATALSSRLVGWCLANQPAANWDAANLASCLLAEKLGYQSRGSYDACYLKKG